MTCVSDIRKVIALVLVAAMLASLAAPTFVHAGAATDDLKQIEYKYYFRGKYQQAIEALQTFLARVDLTIEEDTRAREFLAASYVLGGAPAMGKDVFLQVLAKNPSYTGPDPTVFKLDVMNVYGEARSEYAAVALRNAPPSLDVAKPAADALPATTTEKPGKPIYKKWWLYAGAAALLVAVGAAAGGSDEPTGGGSGGGGVVVGVTVR